MKDDKLDAEKYKGQLGTVDSNDGKAVSGILIIPINPTSGDVEVDSKDVKVMDKKSREDSFLCV